MMKRREFIGLVGGAAVTCQRAARAQQPMKVYRIGTLSEGPGFAPYGAGFFKALRELGWIEGKNIVFEHRYADYRVERLPELAAELVRQNVDIVVAVGTLATRAAKQATPTIPIVMIGTGDPIADGLVASLARPGGNVTGLSNLNSELGAKRPQMLREVFPRLSRVAVLWNGARPVSARLFSETEGAARTLGIEVYSADVRSPTDLDNAYEMIVGRRPDALITILDPLIFYHRKQIAEFAAKNRLPSMHGERGFADAGGLMAYGGAADLFRRAAGYVNKILKGAKPADLPVEQPTKIELVINLKTAKALGLAVPPSLLARADEVIE
jgi:putative tryptophan/tyrosine transport system substrate-binding protein